MVNYADQKIRHMALFGELKRRTIIRVAVAYLAYSLRFSLLEGTE